MRKKTTKSTREIAGSSVPKSAQVRYFSSIWFFALLIPGLALCVVDLIAIIGGSSGKVGYALALGGAMVAVAIIYWQASADSRQYEAMDDYFEKERAKERYEPAFPLKDNREDEHD